MSPGTRVTIINAANTPYTAGDHGTIHTIRDDARELPFGVAMDNGHIEWFAAHELKEEQG